MKVTKAMLKKAEDEHFNKEDMMSLNKMHSLSYIYHKERGHKKAKQFLTSAKVKAMVKKLEGKKAVRKKMKKKRDIAMELKIKGKAYAMSKKPAPLGSTEWVKQQTSI
ncbi:MAG: hypothetical protein KAJ49_06040 [Arcobacteraceae bacterium]|nr:hypothetical protein [Arcobacteraceae bacterium]